jgi:hypothetical protein
VKKINTDNPTGQQMRRGVEAQGYRSLSLPMEGLLKASPSKPSQHSRQEKLPSDL